jgi:hypothetical protein
LLVPSPLPTTITGTPHHPLQLILPSAV